MKAGTLTIFLTCLWPTVASAQLHVRQNIRDIPLDATVKVHAVEVVAAQSITTTIRLPDSFEEKNVMCGNCIEVQPGEAEEKIEQKTQDTRNWIIEKHAAERSIHVRPAKIPSRLNPASAFETNIFVSLDGGHAVNITLRLIRLDNIVGAERGGADAVVNLTLPASATLKGQLAVERQKIWESFRSEVDEGAHKLFIERLFGEVRCKTVSWRRPHRTDRTVIKLNQLCSRLESPKTFWVLFEVENRSDADLIIDRVELEPESPMRSLADPLSYWVEKQTLAFGQATRGVALLSLDPDSQLPSSWRLRLTPGSPDREAANVEHLVF